MITTPDTITMALLVAIPGVRILWVMINGGGYRFR